MLKRWYPVTYMLILAGLIMTPGIVNAESAQDFRQQNGLQVYDPPVWFVEGYFIASEKNPGYVFGPVQDFVRTLKGTTTWLIEDLELKRLEQISVDGKKVEYTVFLEAVSPEGTDYWVFVALPHESAQAWFDARRAFHGGKAVGYYGETRKKLEGALSQGFEIKAELRFLIEKGYTSLEVPENVIMSRYKFQPVFDLGAGHRIDPAEKTK